LSSLCVFSVYERLFSVSWIVSLARISCKLPSGCSCFLLDDDFVHNLLFLLRLMVDLPAFKWLYDDSLIQSAILYNEKLIVCWGL
jgi:hypothetical protein